MAGIALRSPHPEWVWRAHMATRPQHWAMGPSNLEGLQQERVRLSQKLGATEGAMAETRSARDTRSRQLEKALAVKNAKPVAPARRKTAPKA